MSWLLQLQQRFIPVVHLRQQAAQVVMSADGIRRKMIRQEPSLAVLS
jgi:hypothetical protein